MISSVQTNQQKTTAMTIKVVRSTYRGAGVLGDYLWMIDQPEFARALLIFNDNEEQFDAYVAGEANGFTAGVAMRRFAHYASIRHLAQQVFRQVSMAVVILHLMPQPSRRSTRH